MTTQFADPHVSQLKFNREIEAFKELRADFERKGWFLVEADYPTVFVLLGVPNVKPWALLAGVLLDYTNYDAAPPSVKLVDPFTRRPFLNREVPTRLNRALPAQTVPVPGAPGGQIQIQGEQPLMQAHSDDDIPFLCLAGTREYHEHPGHSGDAWELHRAGGAGALVRLLEIINKYGVEPIRGYGVNLVPQVGFDLGPPPP
jgi:hypothetical protein